MGKKLTSSTHRLTKIIENEIDKQLPVSYFNFEHDFLSNYNQPNVLAA